MKIIAARCPRQRQLLHGSPGGCTSRGRCVTGPYAQKNEPAALALKLLWTHGARTAAALILFVACGQTATNNTAPRQTPCESPDCGAQGSPSAPAEPTNELTAPNRDGSSVKRGASSSGSGSTSTSPNAKPPPLHSWSASYTAVGLGTYESVAQKKEYRAPPIFFLNRYPTKRAPGNDLLSLGGSHPDYVNEDGSPSIAFEIRRTDEAIAYIGLTYPRPEGQITYNFSIANPLPWLTMNNGQQLSSDSTQGGIWRISLTRKDFTWSFLIVPGKDQPHESSAREVHLELQGDASRPPWKSIRLKSEVVPTTTTDPKLTTDFQLSYCAGAGEPCKPSGFDPERGY